MHDPAALAIAQQETVSVGRETQPRYLVRHLERPELGTSYPDLVDMCEDRIAKLPMLPTWRGGNPFAPPFRLLVDATAVGRPVVDLFRHRGIHVLAVTITSGEQVRQDEQAWWQWYVPKRVLVGALQVTLQQGRLKVARGLPEAATLVKEAQNFQYRLTPAANDQYGAWREGEHDDLLFAVGLIVWYGEQTKGFPRQAGQGQTADAPGSPHGRLARQAPEDHAPVTNPFARI